MRTPFAMWFFYLLAISALLPALHVASASESYPCDGGKITLDPGRRDYLLKVFQEQCDHHYGGKYYKIKNLTYSLELHCRLITEHAQKKKKPEGKQSISWSPFEASYIGRRPNEREMIYSLVQQSGYVFSYRLGFCDSASTNGGKNNDFFACAYYTLFETDPIWRREDGTPKYGCVFAKKKDLL